VTAGVGGHCSIVYYGNYGKMYWKALSETKRK
jgi:hypothetical protein